MRCPTCGATLEPTASDCPRCHTAVPARVRIAGGGVDLLTPVSGLSDDSGDDRTRLAGDEFIAETILAASEEATILASAGDRHANAGDVTPSPTPGDQATVLAGHVPDIGEGVTGAPGVAGGSTDTGPLQPGQAFGARYHIIRTLGVGGMGAVYQAWDAELGVAVAIKVIRREVMADPTTAAEVERRFKRELLLARQVTHKNVVRIHDLGEMQGIKYITMS